MQEGFAARGVEVPRRFDEVDLREPCFGLLTDTFRESAPYDDVGVMLCSRRLLAREVVVEVCVADIPAL